MSEALTHQLLEWLELRPRTYRETMEAWRTSCPKLSIWEDALADNLVRAEGAGEHAAVMLTEAGRMLIGGPSK